MATNWSTVLTDMLKAAEGVAKNEWPKLEGEAKAQFQVLTQVGARIEARKLLNPPTISETNARFLMNQYEMASQNVLYSIEGLTNLLIEEVINAALEVLRTALKSATGGWILL